MFCVLLILRILGGWFELWLGLLIFWYVCFVFGLWFYGCFLAGLVGMGWCGVHFFGFAGGCGLVALVDWIV